MDASKKAVPAFTLTVVAYTSDTRILSRLQRLIDEALQDVNPPGFNGVGIAPGEVLVAERGIWKKAPIQLTAKY